MRAALLALAAAVVLAPAAPSWADPPFAVVEVKAGDVAFSRLYNVRAIASVDPTIATAESVPATGELLITGKAPGRTDVVAITSGRLVAVRVVVRGEGRTAPAPAAEAEVLLAAAKKACPGLSAKGEGAEALLDIPTPGAACRTALFPLLGSGRYLVPQTHVSFDADSLTLQLIQMTAALKAAGITGLQVRYQGAQLMLAGHLSRAEAGRAGVALYRASVGGMPLNDDDLELDGEEDGGF